MEIILVNKPIQTPETLEPQIINGKLYFWCVNDESMKIGETFQEWWKRKKIWMSENLEKRNLNTVIKGIFLYDITPIGGIIGAETEAAMIIRYQWIKEESIKID